MKAFWILQLLTLFAALVLQFSVANASRLKDIANIRGVRENQLVGYGVVVGLNGTGDSKAEFTSKSISRMLDSMGMKLEAKDLTSKNVAAVVLVATLPPFARSGNKIDVTVNAVGDASSLEGGTLIQSPLRAANQQVYAVAQGPLLIGGGTGVKAHPTVGKIPDGAMVERDMDSDFSLRNMFRLTLHSPDFTTAARAAKIVNTDLGGKYAVAKDSATIDIVVPYHYEGNAVEFLAAIESLEVVPDVRAKVVVNEKTGTVVIGDKIRVSKVAISHGNLTLQVGDQSAKGKGKDQRADKVVMIEGETNVGDLVKAMNSLGVSPRDLITILQNVKAAGALHGELEIL